MRAFSMISTVLVSMCCNKFWLVTTCNQMATMHGKQVAATSVCNMRYFLVRTLYLVNERCMTDMPQVKNMATLVIASIYSCQVEFFKNPISMKRKYVLIMLMHREWIMCTCYPVKRLLFSEQHVCWPQNNWFIPPQTASSIHVQAMRFRYVHNEVVKQGPSSTQRRLLPLLFGVK